MKRTVMAITAALFVTPAIADDDFIGYYRGIDPRTGSVDSISITPNGREFAITMHATAFAGCPEGPTTAVATSAGRMNGNVLQTSDGKATCQKSGDVIMLRDGEFRLSHDDELLTLSTPDQATLMFHRMSAD